MNIRIKNKLKKYVSVCFCLCDRNMHQLNPYNWNISLISQGNFNKNTELVVK